MVSFRLVAVIVLPLTVLLMLSGTSSLSRTPFVMLTVLSLAPLNVTAALLKLTTTLPLTVERL